MVQRKEAGTADPGFSEASASVHDVLRSPGQPLEEATRAYFEPRFGRDFSLVRVHRDTTAERSARQLGALAYTVGNDIVFGAGRYMPQTDQGKSLVAHELAHVVQQQGVASAHSIRRQTPRQESFLVRGLPPGADEQHDFVFFNLNDATIPETERHKIGEFATANATAAAINLYGYASEEGVETENLDLVSDRLESVRKELASSFAGDINLIPRPKAGILQINYRSFRSVEMSVGSSRIGAASSNTNTINCEATQNDTIDDNRDTAKGKITSAIDQLTGFQSHPGHPDVETTLDNNFHSHSPATVSTLLRDLRQIAGDLNGLTGDSHRQCSTPEYGPCLGALALTRRPRIIFCPGFFSTDTDERLETLLHEICHYAFFKAHDRAYSTEGVLPFLSTAEALDNAESIAIFVLEVTSPTGTRVESTLTTPTTDTVADCGADETKAKEALAWAQRWNTYALFGMSQTYNNWDTFMFPHIIARLGKINDRYVLAGIFDRYRELDFQFNSDFTMQCVDATDDSCAVAPIIGATDRSLTICPAFFALSLHERIVSLYAEVTKLVPQILDEQRRGYAELARDYKIFFWGLPPT
jgi:outer membrane protein OmpA-like peptidoglycan-associated protein